MGQAAALRSRRYSMGTNTGTGKDCSLKYDVYVRGSFYACVEASCPVAALNAAHAKIGGDVGNGRLVVVRSDERGYAVRDAVNTSKTDVE